MRFNAEQSEDFRRTVFHEAESLRSASDVRLYNEAGGRLS